MTSSEDTKKLTGKAKRLANLRKWKPGESGNIEGGRAHDPLRRMLAEFSNEYLREIIKLAMMGNVDALLKISNDPDEPVIKVGLARSVINATKYGDWPTLERIFERITGKIPVAMDIKATSELSKLTDEEIDTKIKELSSRLNVED